MAELRQGDRVFTRSGGEPLLIGDRLGRGGQGTVFRTELSGRQLAVKWYRPSASQVFDDKIRASLTRLVDGPRPRSHAFIWPIDMVASTELAGFGYVMPLLDSRFITCFQLLSSDQAPDFHTTIKIGLNLVDAFASLHSDGLCYRDVSFGNLYVDPGAGEVAIIDNDNVGTTGEESFIKGTLQFMAPEVMLNEAPPRTESDLYSLALFLFYLFCHGHPLEGAAVDESYNADDHQRLTDEELLLKHFAVEPLFVFDPVDASNRPAAGHPINSWWPVYPKFFQQMFVASFTTGLKDHSLTGRIIESLWRRALHRLDDSIWQCPTCRAALLFDPAEPHRPCWRCHRTPAGPPLLKSNSSVLVLRDGAVLTKRHLMLPGQADEPVAVAELDERLPGAILVRNVSGQEWQVETPGEDTQQVKPGHKVVARPRTIRIGGKKVSIIATADGN
jgi:DNA-binding helix-hairpin-helix protein with protein kinase domain